MDIINIKKSITILFLAIFIIPIPVYPISVPEGIRGFTVTYGTWIESVLSKSILKDILFPEDQEQYDKLQRLIITSERLSEEGNHKEALSYLRRAEFFLEDIEKTLGHKYGWTKKNYSADEMKSWTDNARESWVMLSYQRISLYIQYEYFYILNFKPETDYFNYILNAEKIYNDLNKNTRAYAQLQSSGLLSYLSRIESSWNIAVQNQKAFSIDKMMEYLSKHSDEFLTGTGYWKRKFTKRSVILMAKYGYPENAMNLLNHLMDDKSDTLPVEVIFNLMIYNGKFSEAEKYIHDNINTLNISVVDKWGIYIKYKNKLLSLLLLLKNYSAYDQENDKFISQLEQFTQRIDLSADIYEYLIYQLNNAILNKKIAKVLSSGNDLKEIKNISILISEFTPDDIKHKKMIIESYNNLNINFPVTSVFLSFRKFQLAIESNELASALNHLNSLKNNYPDHYLTSLANLQYKLKTKYKGTSREWYSIWLESIYNSLENPLELVSINSGLFINFDFEVEFFEFLSENTDIFSVRDLGNLLYAVSLLNTWENRIIAPPDYYRPVDFRLMYKYFSRWGFNLSDDASDQNILSMIFLEQVEKQSFCTPQMKCWILYPLKNKIFSFVISADSIQSLSFQQDTDSLMSLLREFYSAAEKPSQLQNMSAKLSGISLVFKPALEQLIKLNIQENEFIYLFTYKYSSLFPIESFYSPDSEIHIADKFKFIRKLPMDQSFAVTCKDSSCLDNDFEISNEKDAENYFFIGIGNTNPGFIVSNPNLDEILDIEGLFSQKKLLSEASGLAGNLVISLEKSKNNIIHVAGEWKDINNLPVLVLNNKSNSIELNNFKFMNNLSYLVFSKNKSSNFSEMNFFNWEKVLATFRYKNTHVIITSMASSSKEFRQAFFYDMYYKIIHKKNTWKEAFFSSMERTKKGFPKSIWPYLLVIYEQ